MFRKTLFHGDFVELKGQLPEGAAVYQVADIRRLDEANGLLRLGLRGQAKVHTRWMPLGTRFWRFIRHTFKFQM